MTPALAAWLRRLADLALTLAAVVGVLCLLVVLAGALFDVRPLIFRSGSMSPQIPTGSLALARTVDHRDIKVGDVVSVPYRGTRVTHRVVSVEDEGAGSLLRLKGDANDRPDPAPYQVTSADRVMVSVPWLGRMIAWFSRTPGVFVLAAYAAVLLAIIVRRGRPDVPRRSDGGGRRKASRSRGRRSRVMMVAVVVGAIGLEAAPGWAAWVDPVPVSGAGLASARPVPPTAVSNSCTANNGLTGSSIDLRWAGVAPAAAPNAVAYEYVLRFFNRSTNVQAGSDVVQAHAGAAGSTQTVSYGSSLLGSLLGLNLLSSTDLRLEVRARLAGTQWYGPALVTINFHSTGLLGIVSFSCNA